MCASGLESVEAGLVFCGSSSGSRPEYAVAARMMGEALAREGYGTRLRRRLRRGRWARSPMRPWRPAAKVHRRDPRGRWFLGRSLTQTLPLSTWSDRCTGGKALMADLSDAFVALPGGYGTLEEFCEVLTWAQLGLHRKPCGLQCGALLARCSRCWITPSRRRFVRPEHRALIRREREPERLLERMASHHSANVEKWIGRDPRDSWSMMPSNHSRSIGITRPAATAKSEYAVG